MPTGFSSRVRGRVGLSGSFKSFLDGSPEDIARVARTNLLGALLCTRAAIKVMENQERVGHVFNMDGAGAWPDLLLVFHAACFSGPISAVQNCIGVLKHLLRGCTRT